jgi:hypothetical protein
MHGNLVNNVKNRGITLCGVIFAYCMVVGFNNKYYNLYFHCSRERSDSGKGNKMYGNIALPFQVSYYLIIIEEGTLRI